MASVLYYTRSLVTRDIELGRFAWRELESEYPYLIIDARYEKLRENGVIRSRTVLVAIGIDWEGRRQGRMGMPQGREFAFGPARQRSQGGRGEGLDRRQYERGLRDDLSNSEIMR